MTTALENRIPLIYNAGGYPLAPGKYCVIDGKVRVLTMVSCSDGTYFVSRIDYASGGQIEITEGASVEAFAFACATLDLIELPPRSDPFGPISEENAAKIMRHVAAEECGEVAVEERILKQERISKC